MVKALIDTNILIDYLNAVPEARTELSLHSDKAISIITWMEVMVGAAPDVAEPTRTFLEGFDLIGLDRRIAGRAVDLRRRHKVKLPDAVIWASAQECAMLLVTRDAKDFPAGDPGIRVPYSF